MKRVSVVSTTTSCPSRPPAFRLASFMRQSYPVMPESRPVFATFALKLTLMKTLRFALALVVGPIFAATPQVEWFSPQGTAKQVRQAVARFTAPMVSLGDPRLEDPFNVDCGAKGKGHWADTRNWVYD